LALQHCGVSDIRKIKNSLLLFPVFITISAAIYFIQICLFKTPMQTYFYLLQDLAFIPIQVFIVSFVINSLLSRREKKQKIKKINVIISAFFVECGTSIIENISLYISNLDDLIKELDLNDPNYDQLKSIQKKILTANISFGSNTADLDQLRVLLSANKAFMLAMLENSGLLTHDSFTDMLWAVFHTADELTSRTSLSGLPTSDIAHLNNDILRAYRLLVCEWLDYMKYLKTEYSYLFSLASRKNPFYSIKDVVIH
jgi:hypothetical protein